MLQTSANQKIEHVWLDAGLTSSGQRGIVLAADRTVATACNRTTTALAMRAMHVEQITAKSRTVREYNSMISMCYHAQRISKQNLQHIQLVT